MGATYSMGAITTAEVDKRGTGAATGSGTAPSTRQWKRSRHRPSFARVYVGGGNSLELERMRVTVRIEGARARTVVDHIFRNPHGKPLEGTFEYPLPAGASVCYYAMFLNDSRTEIPDFFPPGTLEDLPPGVLASMAPPDVGRKVHRPTWGKLREARVVHREKARRTYEEVVRRKIDPALLEYAGGNTFRGRVFPVPARGFNRVLIAYEEPLDVAGGAVRYRFPLPDCDLDLLHLTATLPAAGVTSDTWTPQKGVSRKVVSGRIVYDQAWEKTRGPGGEAVLAYVPENLAIQAIAGPDPTRSGWVYHARLRPDLPAKVERPWADRAVFLLDTSLSEHPDRFNANLKILERILEKDTAIRRFNVLCFDVGAWWVESAGWILNDDAGRRKALRRLDGVLLEGATDLGAALGLLARTRWDEDRPPVNVFLLSDGQVNWGEQDPDRLLAGVESGASMIPRFFCYRTGHGADNLALFHKLTRTGGGVFNVFNEAMADRAALAHRRPCLLVDEIEVTTPGETGARPVRDVVIAGRQAAVFPGGELVVAWRSDGDDPSSPAHRGIRVKGRFQGKTRELVFPVEVSGRSELAARAWAEMAVNQILDSGDPEAEPLATAYAQRFNIGSRITSFLVLETDADYEAFGIEAEARKLKVQDVAHYLDAVYSRRNRVASRKEAFLAYLDRVSKRTGLDSSGAGDHVRALCGLLKAEDFQLPAGDAPCPLPGKGAASGTYLEARKADRRKVQSYLDEATRRMEGSQAFLGLRALSTVVEMHPGRSDALRLVGYRLLSMKQPAYAASLFDRVRESRPFEPHAYRDLARSLEAAGRFGLAAVYYEIVLAGTWHGRFHASLKTVVLEEYCRMMRGANRGGSVGRALAECFCDRLEHLASTSTAADILVTISWNTDSTDVDLWVVDPDGEACGYNHMKTHMGGELLDDLTVGYGPERFRLPKGKPGDYVVLVHYFRENPNLLAGETHVDVAVCRKAGGPGEEIRRFQVILKRKGQACEVCRIKL